MFKIQGPVRLEDRKSRNRERQVEQSWWQSAGGLTPGARNVVIPLLKKPLAITGRAKDVNVSFIGSVTSSPTRKVTTVRALPMGTACGWCHQLPPGGI